MFNKPIILYIKQAIKNNCKTKRKDNVTKLYKSIDKSAKYK